MSDLSVSGSDSGRMASGYAYSRYRIACLSESVAAL